MDGNQVKDLLYHGCQQCFDFSMIFGGSNLHSFRIKNDEDFELVKADFVKHFNEKHKDLYKNKQNNHKTFKKISTEISASIFSHWRYSPYK